MHVTRNFFIDKKLPSSIITMFLAKEENIMEMRLLSSHNPEHSSLKPRKKNDQREKVT